MSRWEAAMFVLSGLAISSALTAIVVLIATWIAGIWG